MFDTVIGIILLVMALFLIVSILMQSGKSKRLSGTIAGGAETFFGKQKGQAINKRLSMVTNVVAVVFAALVLTLFLMDAKQKADDKKAVDSVDSVDSVESVESVEAVNSVESSEPVESAESSESVESVESSESAEAGASVEQSAESAESSEAVSSEA